MWLCALEGCQQGLKGILPKPSFVSQRFVQSCYTEGEKQGKVLPYVFIFVLFFKYIW
jgi:hypothetical protein